MRPASCKSPTLGGPCNIAPHSPTAQNLEPSATESSQVPTPQLLLAITPSDRTVLPANTMAPRSVGEAQALAGLDGPQWKRFYVCGHHLHNVQLTTLKYHTNKESKALIEAHPEWTWASVPYNQKMNILHRLNSELVKEEVPGVPWEVFHWRMSLRIRDIKAAQCGSFRISGNH